jgi:23S rRNA (cytidine1920-2'-O)/16S rRNA (cytidine1409-2'-O)-methyltransferase
VARKAIKKRADLLLVEKGLADTRERAQALIMEGLVYTPAGKVLKPGSPTATDTSLEVRGGLPYVSRGGVKLAHALDRFGLDVSGLVALDVGASTGGFTDCLLQRGARKVSALDVGHGQMDYRLRQDPRVVVIERVNARYPFSLVAPEADRGGPARTASEEDEEAVDIATVDVSFISAARIMSSVAQHVKRGGFIILLIKPQFEAGRDEVGRGGVIKDPRVHAGVLARAILWVVEAGFRLRDLTPSPILGDAGNREFFLLLQK